jgi:hypothetical protein
LGGFATRVLALQKIHALLSPQPGTTNQPTNKQTNKQTNRLTETPPHNPPSQVVNPFTRRVITAMETGDMSVQPYIFFPLLPLAHIVNVSLPGQVGLRGRRPGLQRLRLRLRLRLRAAMHVRGRQRACPSRRLPVRSRPQCAPPPHPPHAAHLFNSTFAPFTNPLPHPRPLKTPPGAPHRPGL